MRAIILSLLLLGGTTQSYAQFYDGNSLYQVCDQRGNNYSSGVCGGYVIGTIDTYLLTKSYPLCLPTNATAGQLTDVVIRYLETRPDQRHYAAASVVWTALTESFPC